MNGWYHWIKLIFLQGKQSLIFSADQVCLYSNQNGCQAVMVYIWSLIPCSLLMTTSSKSESCQKILSTSPICLVMKKITLMWPGLLIWKKTIFKQGNSLVELIRLLDCPTPNNIWSVLTWTWGLTRERVGSISGLIDICLWLLW